MKKWIVVFESDDDFLKPGETIKAIENATDRIPIQNGILREFPQRPPFVHYDFETYQTGFAKGCNWILDDLEGIPHGEYDPMGLKQKEAQNDS